MKNFDNIKFYCYTCRYLIYLVGYLIPEIGLCSILLLFFYLFGVIQFNVNDDKGAVEPMELGEQCLSCLNPMKIQISFSQDVNQPSHLVSNDQMLVCNKCSMDVFLI